MSAALLSQRISQTPRSFIRDILKTASDPAVISFAGGLPNPALFPHRELSLASSNIFAESPTRILQYSNTEGHAGLREWIAARYRTRQGLDINAAEILITNGSQQALDLLGKCLLDEGDAMLIEQPGYLGAIQALSLYRPRFLPVSLAPEGVDLRQLAQHLSQHQAKLFYCVPEFQNPSGLSHNAANRRAVSAMLQHHPTLLIEDNPYGELRFSGEAPPSYRQLLPEQTVLLGSFSKTLAPSLRLGWVVAPPWLMERLVTAKQASDLHSSNLLQELVYRYLCDNDFERHIATINHAYHRQMRLMRQAITEHFPPQVKIADTEGGMFLWATLPRGNCSTQLFQQAIAQGVAFVPGSPFTLGTESSPSFRLNYTNSSDEEIHTGIARLGKLIHQRLE